MRRVWLNSFLLILVWPGSCGNAEASSVGPSCTATSATAAPRRAAVTVRLHEGSVPIVATAATTTARAEAVRLLPALQDCQPACRPRARAAGAQKDYTGRDLYAADHQRAVLPEHIATAARPRAASVWLPFACFQSIVCSARHLTASCTILLQNLHSRE